MTEEFPTGGVIAGYTVLGVCGHGSYGVVCRVSDSLGAELALKVLPSGKISKRELDALIRFRACRHPNLLTVLHIGELPDGRYFYTMDLADPGSAPPEEYQPDTLASRLAAAQPFAPDEAERILRELLAGLDELHRAHLLHRDIKPANILFIRGRAVLADIGLVTADSSASLIGTPDYMPEELLKTRRPMSPADDSHALGLILYQMLTGEPPNKFPSVPKTLHDPAALRLLKIAEKACTPPGFPDAGSFLKQLDRPLPFRRNRGAWKWAVIGGMMFLLAILNVFTAFGVWRFVLMRKEAAMQETKPLQGDLPVRSGYAPEVAALLKKYQFTKNDIARLKYEQEQMALIEVNSRHNARMRAVIGARAEERRPNESDAKPWYPYAAPILKCLKEIDELKDMDPEPSQWELERLEQALRQYRQLNPVKTP